MALKDPYNMLPVIRKCLSIPKLSDRTHRDSMLNEPWNNSVAALLFARGKLSRCLSISDHRYGTMITVDPEEAINELPDVISYVSRAWALLTKAECNNKNNPYGQSEVVANALSYLNNRNPEFEIKDVIDVYVWLCIKTEKMKLDNYPEAIAKLIIALKYYLNDDDKHRVSCKGETQISLSDLPKHLNYYITKCVSDSCVAKQEGGNE